MPKKYPTAYVTHELVELENLLRLVAFATEARRTLCGIERAKANLPEVKKGIDHLVDYSNQWTFHEDNAAEVLTQVANRLAAITAKV